MLQTILAIVHNGKIEPVEPLALPEGTKLIITTLPDDVEEEEFRMNISNAGFALVWDNEEDDVYKELLNERKVHSN